MKNTNDFTVANRATEKQKNDYQREQKEKYEREQSKIADRKRVQDIEHIQDKSEQRKMLNMLTQRDHDFENRRNANDLKIQQEIKKELARDKLETPSPVLTPEGMGKPKPDLSTRREDRLRTEIRQRMGQKFEAENKLLEKEANRKIDDTLKKTLERQNEQSQDRQQFQTAQPEPKPEQQSFKDRLRSSFKESSRDKDLTREFSRTMERKPFD